MNINTDFDKIDKVLSKITGKELKSFVRVYSYTHDDFATAFVEKYWKPERGNYKEMVEACFAHAGVLGKRFGEPDLDWRKIEDDLLGVMKKAVSMRKKGNLIDAAIIAGYVMTTTCGEFKRDHEHYKPVRYDLWAEENKVLKGIVTQAADMVRELLIQSDEIEEDSRLGMLGDIVKRCDEIGDNYFMRFEWFVDEAMPLLCGDDEKAYMAHISKRLKNRKEKYFHYRYYIQKADCWIAHGKRAKAEKLMMDKRDDENIRSHYIDCLIEWKEYKKAIEIIDDNKDDFKAQYNKWEDKVVEAEKMLDRMKMFFVHHSWNLWEMFAKYIKYVPKKDQAFVGELMSDKICRLALLKEKPKEFAWLLGEVQRMMGHSRIADDVIKEGIRNLIKENPKNYYLKNYLGCVL